MQTKPRQRGGAREGAGRKSGPATATHPVRCTDKGWEWLQSTASSKGHSSVGKWADAAGREESAMNSTTDELRAVVSSGFVRLCRRYNAKGYEFRLLPQPVAWSGDTIDVCSICGMDIYSPEWGSNHSEAVLEMAEPNDQRQATASTQL